MSQLQLDGIGVSPVIFTLPALTYPKIFGGGTFYGFFPYDVKNSPPGMECGFPGDALGPFCSGNLTNEALIIPFVDPANLPVPFTVDNPSSSYNDCHISVTDSNGYQVYLFQGATYLVRGSYPKGGVGGPGQAFPGGLHSGVFTLTPTGPPTLKWRFWVP